ncbi:MAG: metalloendopeptidase-like membrane protein [Parcubacteria group bacterium Gr01-1014_38]|nr:MAG: metalloendopeptidase-like membrane protein [Parcubacteria group bacterium Gr01-1014_38]
MAAETRVIPFLPLVLLGGVLTLLGGGCVRTSVPTPPAEAPVAGSAPVAVREDAPSSPRVPSAVKDITLGALPNAAPAFGASLSVPASWEAEVVPEIEAINLYDPAAPGGSPREQSQIFIRHFRGDDFLTLATVTIHARTPGTVAGRTSVAYVIEKKPGVPAFPHQPAWRNARHRVTDIRLRDARPSEFLVFGKNPALPDAVFDDILSSLRLVPEKTSALVLPTRDFFAAVTKKPFGIFVTPETSPVQPERFRGYHTAADAELPANTPVVAIADGTVTRSGIVSGYGGLVAVLHEVDAERLVGIYGHLDPGTLPPRGTRVRAGQRVGVLGEGFTRETDGERPHLHFGLYRGPDANVAGYVSREERLSAWHDPVAFLREQGAVEP